jgi:hypothetical protein
VPTFISSSQCKGQTELGLKLQSEWSSPLQTIRTSLVPSPIGSYYITLLTHERVRNKTRGPCVELLKHHAMMTYGGVEIQLLRFYLSNGLKRIVSFTSRPLYPTRMSPQCPLQKKLGGRKSRSDQPEYKTILVSSSSRNSFHRTSNPQPVVIPTELSPNM